MQELFTEEGYKLYNDPERIPWDVYPRPLMERDSFLNLCGWWDFSVKEGDSVILENSSVRVPFPPESVLSGINTHFPEGAALIYKREVELPPGFRKERLILHVDAADQHARVFADGKLCGSHDGGYEHFSMELPVDKDSFSLVIETTDDLRDQDEPYGKQRIKRGGMWYTPFSGIWQSVWLESVPDEYVKKLVINSGREEVSVSTQDESQEGLIRVFTPEGEESFELKGGEAVIKPRCIRNWCPEDPYLYHFELELKGGDRLRSYFALRDIRTGTDENGVPRLFLNGKPCFFNGLLDQGYFSDGLSTPADPSLYESDIMKVKELGFNTLRKHVKVEPDLYYAACDRLGIVVFQDMINNGHYSFFHDTALPNIGFPNRDDTKIHVDDRTRSIFISRAKSAVKQLNSFPCILYWTIFNEGWGQFDSVNMCRIFKEMLPDSIVDAASGWHDMGAGDVKSIHKYNDRYVFKASDKPVILSEFGGYTCRIGGHLLNEDKSYGYGAAENPAELAERLEKLYREEIFPAVENGLCAAIYTQLSDVEDEINGILTYDHKVCKLPPDFRGFMADSAGQET